jgi:4-alpha-glucanotransferase
VPTPSPKPPATFPNRSAGILLHPTSLPGPYGIGDLGPASFLWIDTLDRARQRWWQVLPLGPTGYGDSPYQSFSTFAGNTYLLSPELLLKDGLLEKADLADLSFPQDHVDYGAIFDFKVKLLSKAWARFQTNKAPTLKGPFDEFVTKQAAWLDDYALYMALKGANEGASWQSWPNDLLLRKPAALDKAKRELAGPVGMYKFGQYLFFRQWKAVKQYANSKNIRLIGDVPIFVSSDSADVWANPELFYLDAKRQPKVVAGVPPDYFSSTGQLWGNPLYDWAAAKRTDYAWWVARLRSCLEQVDVVRIDHFRGFESYWEVPAGNPTAEHGKWVKGPGADLFTQLKKSFGTLPLIAEDLGIITAEVDALRTAFNLPGMRILQFAFSGDPKDRYLPHNYDRNTVVYTGTHDNDTTQGWYATTSDKERDFVRRYLARDGGDVSWDFIRAAWSSVADYAIAPLQDILNLGTEARMNMPGRAVGNWGWRFRSDAINDGILGRLAEMTGIYGRC